MPDPIHLDGLVVDLSGRFYRSDTVAASPAAAAETTVCSVTLPGGLPVQRGVFLFGYLAFTVGTNGTSCNVKLRQTDTSGTTLKASGLVNATAANLSDRAIHGFDASPSNAGQTYVLTLTVTAGSAASTVSAACLYAVVV